MTDFTIDKVHERFKSPEDSEVEIGVIADLYRYIDYALNWNAFGHLDWWLNQIPEMEMSYELKLAAFRYTGNYQRYLPTWKESMIKTKDKIATFRDDTDILFKGLL